MLTCKDFLNELNDFLDDATDPGVRQELQSHLDECPNCWVICDTTKKTIAIYKGMDLYQMPQQTHERLLSALEKKAHANQD